LKDKGRRDYTLNPTPRGPTNGVQFRSCRGIGEAGEGRRKEAVGKVVGDAKLESEGKADKAQGKVQNAIGGLKDAVRDAAKK
jgi:uncharacterized protein YjbJ (UPF0337 family)